jgi:hypothetical protein
MAKIAYGAGRRVDLRGSFLSRAYTFLTELHSAFDSCGEPPDEIAGLLEASKAAQDAVWELRREIERAGVTRPSVMNAWSGVDNGAIVSKLGQGGSDHASADDEIYLSKDEAARYVGRSPKTLERYTKEGRVRKRLERAVGRKPLPTFNKADLYRLIAAFSIRTTRSEPNVMRSGGPVEAPNELR